ncbi:ferredoxin [Chitinophaga silvisoli]|uniref:Ferredoxin n=1 Tax=Chitinophaga silvisoli TaxID=2291814 RepID=A0A3E1P4F0_9BACT|nr:ferredoxin [Chitinophaga silvisoli]RFM34990.1 ferredoxin [Chitinophaga silvisoli]
MPKIIHYRDKCIGCGICFEMQPELWRMSRKDGKAVLLGAEEKRETDVLVVNNLLIKETKVVAAACPVKIIKTLG